MARGFYQNTAALATSDGTLKALAGISVFVYLPGTLTPANIYTGRSGGALATNPIITDITGIVEFYADVGEYDIRFRDTNAVPRIADRTVAWSAFNGSAQGIPTSLMTRDSGLDMTAFAADVLRQFIPVGQVIDWWRPDAAVPLPSGFEICDGRTISAGSHDFAAVSGSSITLPDLRNKFIMGADVQKTDGTISNNGDGAVAFNVVHPNAPGIRGTGGSNTAKVLTHTHSFAHTHGISGQAVTAAFADRSLAHAHSAGSYVASDHLHSGGTLYTGSGNRGSSNAWGGTAAEAWAWLNHLHSMAGGNTGATDRGNPAVSGNSGGEGAPDHKHLSSVAATTTASQSTSTTDNGTMSATTDMRPQHVGLLKLMKVRRN